jgi:hypothetical protein
MAEPVNVINALILLILTYHGLASWDKSEEMIFLIGLCIVVVSYLVDMYISNKKKSQIPKDIKTFVFLTSSIAFLAPLLQSLAVSYCNDTIVLLATFFFTVHCLCYDF